MKVSARAIVALCLVLFVASCSGPANDFSGRYALPCKIGDTNVAWYLAQDKETRNKIVDEYRLQFAPSMRTAQAALRSLFPQPAYFVSARLKTAVSIMEKFKRKLREGNPYKCFSDMKDIAGLQIVISGWQKLIDVANVIEQRFKVEKKDELISLDRSALYRAVHFDVDVGGRSAEIQIHTRRGTILADASHILVYKGPFADDEAVQDYLKELSYSVFMRDLGLAHTLPAPGPLPTPATKCILEILPKLEAVRNDGPFTYTGSCKFLRPQLSVLGDRPVITVWQ